MTLVCSVDLEEIGAQEGEMGRETQAKATSVVTKQQDQLVACTLGEEGFGISGRISPTNAARGLGRLQGEVRATGWEEHGRLCARLSQQAGTGISTGSWWSS